MRVTLRAIRKALVNWISFLTDFCNISNLISHSRRLHKACRKGHSRNRLISFVCIKSGSLISTQINFRLPSPPTEPPTFIDWLRTFLLIYVAIISMRWPFSIDFSIRASCFSARFPARRKSIKTFGNYSVNNLIKRCEKKGKNFCWFTDPLRLNAYPPLVNCA